jgi:hypothetical protein
MGGESQDEGVMEIRWLIAHTTYLSRKEADTNAEINHHNYMKELVEITTMIMAPVVSICKP